MLNSSTINIASQKDHSVVSVKTRTLNKQNSAELFADVYTLEDGVRIKFRQSSFVLNEKEWSIEKLGELEFRKDQITANNIAFTQGFQEISIEQGEDEKGIKKERLIATGYGIEGMVNNCKKGVVCTSQENQMNIFQKCLYYYFRFNNTPKFSSVQSLQNFMRVCVCLCCSDLGVHIDGYVVVAAHSFVCGAAGNKINTFCTRVYMVCKKGNFSNTGSCGVCCKQCRGSSAYG